MIDLFHIQLLDLPLLEVFQTDFTILVLFLLTTVENVLLIEICSPPPPPTKVLPGQGKSNSLEDSLEALPAESSHT